MMKEFRISDAFYKIDTPKIKAKANDFPTEYSEEYSIPLLTAGAENQGFNRWAKPSDCSMVINNVISVSANGANSGVCFYQPCDFAVLQDAYAVKVHNHEIGSVEEGLYLTGALNKAVRDNHSWVNKAGWNRIKDDIVELPVIESSDPCHVYTIDDIDWQYMQDRIAELEQDRIAELEAYLAATGLDDYELTDEDKAVLCDEKVMKTYRLGEVFSIESVNKLSIKGKNYVMDKDIISEDGTTPYIAAISTNNGITGYSNYLANNKGDCITLSTTADSSNTVFYQEQPFIGRQQIAGIRRADGEIMERYVGLYLTAVIRKITRQFNYANKLTKEYLKNCNILLPVIVSPDPNHTYTIDDIDWQYMERYIRAMEKLAIADVAKYKDKVIATTKEIVEQ